MCLILGIGATTFLVVRIIPSSLLIGERERGPTGTIFLYLFVALYFPIFRFYAGIHYRKSLLFHVHRVSRMRKYMPLRI